VAGNECRLQSVNLKLGDRCHEQGGAEGGDSRGLRPYQCHRWIWEAFNFTVDTPAPLQSVMSNILQALRESESKLPMTMLVAIGVAATAVVVVTSFLLITYVKFKKFSATSKDRGDSKAAVA
jgi:hypothetical protein